jgi:hypothetical protein
MDVPTPGIDNPVGSLLGNYTYLYIDVYTRASSRERLEVYIDPSASKSIIGQPLLSKLKYIVERRKGKVTGVSNKTMLLN